MLNQKALTAFIPIYGFNNSQRQLAEPVRANTLLHAKALNFELQTDPKTPAAFDFQAYSLLFP